MTDRDRTSSDLKLRVRELAEACIHGQMSPEAAERLEQLVCKDHDARRYYVEYVQDSFKLHQTAVGLLTGAGVPSEGEARLPILGFLDDTIRQSWDFLASGPRLPLLITAIFAALVFTVLGIRGVPDFRATADEWPVVAGVYVARLTGVVDCTWAEDWTGPEVGADLVPGQVLNLTGGLAEVTFRGGARVILEGPAVLGLQSGENVRLQSGRLTVLVPDNVPAFTIDTPKFTIIELGTGPGSEYGVIVGKRGTGDLVVMVGSVELQVDTPSGDGYQQRVEAGQAVWISSSGKTASVETRREGRPFVRQMPSPTQPQQIYGLRMWLKADAGVCRDTKGTVPAAEGDPVGCWIDQSGNRLSPRQEMPHRRPRLFTDNRGKPILRFNGKNQYLHEPAGSGPASQVLDPSDAGAKPQFTVFFAFRVANRVANVPDRHRQGLLGQFTETTNSTSRYFHIARGGKFSYDEFEPWYRWLRSPTGTIVPERTHIGVVARNDARRSLYVDGVLMAGDAAAEDYAGPDPHRWWIGARAINGKLHDPFHGDIAEILVYDRALKQSEQLSVERYLRNQYINP